MSTTSEFANGSIVWQDLTIEDAEKISHFYSEVVGWEPQPHPMGEYDDYSMFRQPEGENDPQVVAGVCHARGPNSKVPPQWLIYVKVPDINASIERCCELGGEVIDGPRRMGKNAFCVIKDPAGAVMGLIE